MPSELRSIDSYRGPDRNQRRFLVNDPHSAWLVRNGFVDIFAMDAGDGEPNGVPRHLVRLGEKDAFFGLDMTSSRLVLVAAKPPSAVVEQRTLNEVIPSAGPCRVDCGDGEGIALFERWTSALLAPIAALAESQLVQRMTPGDRICAEEQDVAVASADGILWAELERGVAHCMGRRDLELDDRSAWFPIDQKCWLLLKSGGVIRCHPTSKIVGAGQLAAGSAQCGDFLARTLLLEREILAARRHEAVEARAAAEADAIHDALESLASPLSGSSRRVTREPSVLTGHPVVEVCKLVGHQLGLELNPPPDLLRGRAVANPVEDIANACSVRVRRVLLRSNWWRNDHGPLVASWEKEGTPVALLRRGSRRYVAYDPGTRQSQPVTEKLAGRFHAFAYTFYASLPQRRLNGWDLARFSVAVCKTELPVVGLMSLGIGLLALMAPYLTGLVFDDVIPGARRGDLVNIVLFLFAGIFAGTLFTLVRSFAMLRIQTKLDASLQAAVWDRLLSLPAQFFRRFAAGDLAQRSMGISAMRQALTGSVLTSIFSGIFSVVSLILLFYYDWHLAIAATVLIVCGFLFSAVCGYLQVREERRIQRLRGTIAGMVLQFITGIAKLRVSGSEVRAFAAWARMFGHQRRLAMKARLRESWIAVLNPVFPVFCAAVLFSYESYLSARPGEASLPTGQFLAFMAAFMQFLISVLYFSTALTSVLGIVPLYERAAPILRETPEIDPAKSDPGQLSGAIEVTQVHFGYGTDGPLALQEVSLSVHPGQFVAIAGPSGSGKSTLLRLLLGFESPRGGSIYYDGKDLTTLNLQRVRQQMGVVLQDGVLMRGALYLNIIGNLPLTIDDAWRAARMAAVDQDIKEMPMGMHTVVSEGGRGFSGGQRQRILIARAIVRNPRFLFFDEATSALDNETQAVVNSSLECLQTTRVVVAHRLTTIRRADCIYVLDKGRIVQQGTFEELIAREGLFREMARRQLIQQT